jgi:hypothetical protein
MLDNVPGLRKNYVCEFLDFVLPIYFWALVGQKGCYYIE